MDVMTRKIQQAPDRLEVLGRIAQYEKNGWFDRDVENDPPTVPLYPGDVDFLNKKLSNKLKNKTANICGSLYFRNSMRKKEVIFCGATGLENLKNLRGGAVITCNHMNVFDHFAVYLGLKKHFKRYKLHKFVREGNFSMPGLIGFFLRHCNTLPLCKSYAMMKECMGAASEILAKGGVILIYPEEAMWWNYRKPRPVKSGAFFVAAKNDVPVVPCFITLNDSGITGKDGFAVQEYTLHISPPVYPDKALSVTENTDAMRKQNESVWKDIYEKTYGEKLPEHGEA